VAFLAALVVLRGELQAHTYHDILHALGGLPGRRVAEAVLLTSLSYLLLAGYDVLGLRTVGRRLAYRKAAFASFVAHAFSNSIGHSLVTGGALRLRLYTAWGLEPGEIAAVVAFSDLALWLGFAGLAGVLFLVAPLALPAALHAPIASARPLGVALLVLVVLYFIWSARQRPLRLRGWRFTPPKPGLSAAATAVAALDWLTSAAVLYALLPAEARIGWASFAGIFLLAQIVGLVSQVPAGLGVFETLMVWLLGDAVGKPALLGSLLAFRALYYLLPLAAAALALGWHEALARRGTVRRVAAGLSQVAGPLVPHLFAASTFVGGAVLLFSGATPAEHARLRWLQDLVPLPLIEASHFLGSCAGVALLLLARGLQRRLDAAWVAASGLLAAGVVFSLLKGGDFEEALLLAAMLAALLPCRRHFYRRASVLAPRFSAGWIAAILMVLLGSVWLGLFSFKHVDYSHELWWQFALRGDAPRFLRATVGVLVLAAAFALARLLRPAQDRSPGALPAELDRALPIVLASPDTGAWLALTGDKQLLFSASGRSFLMYAVEGRSWIAMGEPAGPTEERRELVWAFRERVDRHGGWPVFYQVGVESLPLYLDLGLALQKIGEEARVELAKFTLEGRDRKALRNVVNRFEKEGYAFEVVPAGGVPPLLEELRAVSDEWRGGKETREKGFSLGFFDERYLALAPIALVRHGRRIVAFANLWLGGGRDELSCDLMRQRDDAPNGTMDFLFVRLMQWGREQGFGWFNLGMAPLAGLEARALSPLWHRLGGFLFRHVDTFYNFQGLRQYKEKFSPVWAPKYLASPGGAALPRILANLSARIAGGLKGVVRR
jgi:phosphatidylglycerol lysyltransferase